MATMAHTRIICSYIAGEVQSSCSPAVAELGVLDLLVVPELLAVVALLAVPEVRVELRLRGSLDVLEVVELLAIARSISVIFGL